MRNHDEDYDSSEGPTMGIGVVEYELMVDHLKRPVAASLDEELRRQIIELQRSILALQLELSVVKIKLDELARR